MYYKKQKDSYKKYIEEVEFRRSYKFYCENCRSYHYLRDKIPYIICRYCGYPVFNTNNPEGKKEQFKYKLKKVMKK